MVRQVKKAPSSRPFKRNKRNKRNKYVYDLKFALRYVLLNPDEEVDILVGTYTIGERGAFKTHLSLRNRLVEVTIELPESGGESFYLENLYEEFHTDPFLVKLVYKAKVRIRCKVSTRQRQQRDNMHQSQVYKDIGKIDPSRQSTSKFFVEADKHGTGVSLGRVSEGRKCDVGDEFIDNFKFEDGLPKFDTSSIDMHQVIELIKNPKVAPYIRNCLQFATEYSIQELLSKNSLDPKTRELIRMCETYSARELLGFSGCVDFPVPTIIENGCISRGEWASELNFQRESVLRAFKSRMYHEIASLIEVAQSDLGDIALEKFA